MRVSWLLQSEVEVPADDTWMVDSEREILDSLRIEKRRRDWRLGRWTAKSALAAVLTGSGVPPVPSRLAILAAADGSPVPRLDDRSLPLPISLSHSTGLALCAVGSGGTALGCDLELIEPHSARFVTDYFTGSEQALIAGAPASTRPRLTTLVWSAKESALKALRLGLTADTRTVEVTPLDGDPDFGGWRRIQVTRSPGDELFAGWWCSRGSHVLTVVTSGPGTGPPSPLDAPEPG